MARMTLLEMTQNILSAMDSDEVNSIHDTVESQQVAETIKETFYDLFSFIEIPEHVGIIRLNSVGDLNRPNYLAIPNDVLSFEWIKYYDSVKAEYRDLTFLPEKEFFYKVLLNKSTHDNTKLVTDDSGVTYYIKDNVQPTYYTILNDDYIVTDSYDSSVDSTLQNSKTFAWGNSEETWSETDSFIPNIDNDVFPLFLAEAKSACFVNLKQIANQKEEQRARRGRVHLHYRKWKDKRQRGETFEGFLNHGRKRR